MAALLVNPRKRRAKRTTAKRRTSLAKRARRLLPAIVKRTSISKYRRNPSPRNAAVMATVKEGAIGAAGAIAAEILLSKLPVPANFKTGTMQPVASALAAVGVGMLVSKYGKKPALGKAMAQGGVTVALHQTMRGFVAGPLGLTKTVGYYGEDFNDMGYTEPTEVYDGDFDAEEELGYFVNQPY
jgi:hypothetical protein